MSQSVYDHPDWRAFVAQIRANPADDTVRLVAADWLEERDPERAEFIRVQCELAKLQEPDELLVGVVGRERHRFECAACRPYPAGQKCDWCRLTGRERRLFRGPHPHAYRPDVVWFNQGNGTETWVNLFCPEWRRGFVESVTCAGPHWEAHGDAVLGREPVVRATLTTWPAGYPTRDIPADVPEVARRAYLFGRRTAWVREWHALAAVRWPGVGFTLPSLFARLVPGTGETITLPGGYEANPSG